MKTHKTMRVTTHSHTRHLHTRADIHINVGGIKTAAAFTLDTSRSNARPLLRRLMAQSLGLLALAASVSICRAQTPAPTPAPAAPPAPTTPSAAPKGDLFVQRALAATAPQGSVSVIARLTAPLLPIQERQFATLGAVITQRLDIIHSVTVRLPAANLKRLSALPFVAHLSADLPIQKNDEFTDDHSGATTAAQQMSATGKGVTVAVVDSGIHWHTDLYDMTQPSYPYRVLANVNFASDNMGTDDLCGHGTHVAGIIAGNGLSSSNSILSMLGLPASFAFFSHTYKGAAPGATLVNVRVLDKTGQGTVTSMVAGIQWVVQNAKKYNIRVMNLSVGHDVGESYTTDPLCQAVETAWKAGITVVCAAGNGGRMTDMYGTTQGTYKDNEGFGTAYGTIQSPGNDPYVITVGAMKNTNGTRAYDHVATYSSRGPTRLDMVMKPDIMAPGNRVISLEAPGSYLQTTYNATNHVPWSTYCNFPVSGDSLSYFQMSGTSMATPVVAGAAALMLGQNPALTPDMIKARLMVSADKWADAAGNYDPCTYGAGYVNVPAALQCTATTAQAALSPSLVKNAATGKVTISNVIWGKNIIWGLNNTTAANALNVIWGNNVIWGTNVIWGNNIIWGSSVWTNNVIWGVSTGRADISLTAVAGEN